MFCSKSCLSQHYSRRLKQHKKANLFKVHSIALGCYPGHSGHYIAIFSNVYYLALIVHCVKKGPNRSSRLQMFFEIGFFINFAIFTVKYLCWSLLLLKLQTFRKNVRCFPVDIAKILRTNFYGTPPVTDSDQKKLYLDTAHTMVFSLRTLKMLLSVNSAHWHAFVGRYCVHCNNSYFWNEYYSTEDKNFIYCLCYWKEKRH